MIEFRLAKAILLLHIKLPTHNLIGIFFGVRHLNIVSGKHPHQVLLFYYSPLATLENCV